MARDSAKARRKTIDSFENFEARVGIQAGNLSGGAGYTFDFVSRNRVEMEAMYRSSWIVGQAVDVVAEDMTKAGIELRSELDPSDEAKLLKAMTKMQLWDQLCDTLKWSRLYGGAVGVLMIDGQDMKTPLNIDSIGRGQFKGILPLDRWLVQPSMEELITEYGPDIGKPKFYDVVADSMALRRQRIHYTRVVRFDGVDLPYWQRISENLWGQSVVERLYDRLVAFDSTTQGAAQLVYKAHLRTYKVPGLREVIAMGGPALEGLLKQIDMIRRMQTNEGMTLMDAADEYEAHQYSFSGMADILLQFGQQLSGALQIPLVRLFGQSPAGLNSTGESDMEMYRDGIHQRQERRLRTPVDTILRILCRSVLGIDAPEELDFDFVHLKQMTAEEKANVSKTTTDAVIQAFDAGLISQRVALKELQQSSDETGIWTNISDEDIEAADDAPPDPGEGDFGEDPYPPEPGADPEGGDPVRGQSETGGGRDRSIDRWLRPWRYRRAA